MSLKIMPGLVSEFFGRCARRAYHRALTTVALLILPLALGLAATPTLAQTAGIQLSRTTFTLYADNDDISYSVRLRSQPSADVTVRIQLDNFGVSRVIFDNPNVCVPIPGVTNGPAGCTNGVFRWLDLTFTNSNWNQWQQVDASRFAETGFSEDGDQSAIFSHTATSSDNSYNNLGGPSFTVTPTSDNDSEPTSALTFLPAAVSVNEDSTDTYSVRLRSDPGNGSTVTITPNSGGLTAFTVAPTSLTFTGGGSGTWSTPQTVTITPVPDGDAGDDTYTIAHSGSGGGVPSNAGGLSLTIVDTVSRGITFNPKMIALLEDDNSTYTFRLATQPSGNVTVAGEIGDVRVAIVCDPNAPSGSDGRCLTGSSDVTRTNAERFSYTFTTTTWNQPATVELVSQSSTSRTSTTISHTATGGGYNSVSASLPVTFEPPTEPRVVLEVSSQSATEGSPVNVTVNLEGGPTLSANTVFPITITNGSAESADYTAISSVTVNAGARSGSASIAITDDNVFEAAETFTVALGTLPSGVRKSRPDEPTSYEITIATSDRPELRLEAPTTVNAGGRQPARQFEFKVIASNPADKDITVPLDVTITVPVSIGGDADGNLLAATDGGRKLLTLSEGDTEVSYSLWASDIEADSSRGRAEAEIVTGADYTVSSTAGSATVTVQNDYTTFIGLTAQAGNISETSGSKTITIALERGLVTPEALAVPLEITGTAVLGTDYTLSAPPTLPRGVAYSNLGSTDLTNSPPTVTFTGGATLSATTATLIVSATSDTLDEANETIGIAMDSAINSVNAGTNLDGGVQFERDESSVSFSITDDDDTPEVSITGPNAALTEGATAEYTISVSGEAQAELSIGLTVSQVGAFVDADDLGAQTLTLASGVTSLNFEVVTLADSADERDGSLTVALNTGTGYTVSSGAGSATVAVNDNDATFVEMSIGGSSDVDEASGSKTITIEISRGLVAGEVLALPLAVGGTATLGTDYTLAAPTSLPTGVTYTTLGSAPTVTFTGAATPTASEATLIFTATSDNLDEGDSESFTINLPTLNANSGTNLTGGAAGSDSVALDITDDDPPPALSVSVSPTTAITEGTSVTYTVSAPNPSAEELTIPYTVSQSTGAAFLAADSVGADELTLPAGDTSVTYTLATASDQNDEIDGSFTFALSTPANDAGYTLVSGETSVTTDVRDDDPTTVTLNVPAGAIAENAGSKTLTVVLGRGLVAGERLTVDVRFAGTATYTTDYTVTRPSGSIPAGITYNSFGATTRVFVVGPSANSFGLVVTAVQDNLNEGASESIIASLAPLNASSGTGLSGGASASGGATFAITDDDSGGGATIAADAAMVAEGTAASFTVTLASASVTATTVNYTVSQTGTVLAANAAGNKSVVVAAGETEATFTVGTASDTTDEVSGSVDVTITSGTGYTVGATSTASVEVTDDDPTLVAIAAASDNSALEGSTTDTAMFTVTLGRGLVDGESLEVPLAVTGIAAAEYSLAVAAATGVALSGNTLTFTGPESGASARTATITFTAADDESATDAANEAVAITIPASSASGTPRMTASGLDGGASGSGTAGITIVDKGIAGGAVSVSAGAAVTEGESATFTLAISTASTNPVTVNVTVAETGMVLAANEDGARTVVIPAGETEATFTVGTASDAIDEQSGSVDVTVNTGTGYSVGTNQASVAVADDDPTVVTIAATDGTAIEGDSDATAEFTVTLSRRLVAGESLVVPIGVAGLAARSEYTLALADAEDIALADNDLTFTGVDADSDTTATITLTANADSVASDAANEAVTVTIPASSASGTPRMTASGLAGGASGAGRARITITDAGITAGAVTIARSAASVTEGGTATFTLTSANAASKATTVNVTIAQTGAVVASSNLGAREVVIPANASSVSFTVATTADAIDEPSGTVTATVAAGTGYTVGATSTVSVEVTDNDPTSVTLAATDTAAAEGDSSDTAAFTVTLGRALESGETLVVPIAVAGFASNAEYSLALTAGTGLSLTGNTLTFTGMASAARIATITLSALAETDTSDADNEAVTVTIPASSTAGTSRMTATGLDGGAVGTGSARIAITDAGVAATPGVTLSGGTLVVKENESASYTIVLDTDPGQGSTVTVTPASANTDLSFSPLSVMFTGGASGTWDVPMAVTVTAGADGDVANDSATITHSVSGYTGVATVGDITVSVTDAMHGWVVEPEELTVAVGDTATYTVRLLSEPSRQVRFTASSDSNGTARVAPTDRQNIAPGNWQTGRQMTVNPRRAGTAIITHANNTGSQETSYRSEPIPSVKVLVTASGAPMVSIAADEASFTEDGSATFTVSSDEAAGSGGLLVDLTAVQEGRYADSGLPTDVWILEDQRAATVTVDLEDDSADESDGSLTLTLSSSEDYQVSSSGSATTILVDNDATLVTLARTSGADANIDETAGESSLTVMLGRALVAGEVLSVPLAVTGTATLNTDYTLAAPARRPAGVTYAGLNTASPSITFTGGASSSASASVRVLASSDAAAESDETINIALGTLDANSGTNLDGGASGSGSAAFTIADDDGTGPVISVTAGAAVTEGANASFTVTAAPAPSANLTVNLSVGASGDFVAGTNTGGKTVTIPTGGSATYTVATVGDGVDEPNGSVTLTAVAGQGYSVGNSGSGTVTVNDNDNTSVTLSAPASNIGETGGSKALTVTLGRALVSGETLTVPVNFAGAATRATFGTDYTIASTAATGVAYSALTSSPITITFTGRASASRTATLTLSATGDTTEEPNENIAVSLGAPTANAALGGATGSGTVSFSITDDDGSLPSVTIARSGASVTEGANATFTVTASAAPDANLTVNLNVARVGNFVTSTNAGSKTVTINSGSTTATFNVATAGDTADEADGSVTVSVATGSGYTVGSTSSATVDINDNDATTVTLSAPASNIGETGGSKQITVTLGRALVSGETLTVPVNFAGANPQATFGTDYTVAAPSTVPGGVGYSATTSSPITITFTGGAGASRAATLTLSARGDTSEESDENIALSLGTLGAASLSGGATGSGAPSFQIIDDDASLPVVSVVQGTSPVTEGTPASFTVSVAPTQSAALTVNVNISRVGNFIASGDAGIDTVTIPTAGTVTYSVDTTADTTDEANGSVTLTATAGRGYTVSGSAGSATVAVNDNDNTGVTLSARAGNIGETGGTKELTVTLGRPLAAGETLAVPLTFGGTATFGSDYTLSSPTPRPSGVGYSNLSSTNLTDNPPTITFTGGAAVSRTATLTVSASNNAVEETDETVTVALGTLAANTALGAATGSGTASFSIIDDDDPSLPTVNVAAGAAVAEGGNATFTFSVSPATHPALTVRYTVTQNGSFLTSGALGAGKTVSLAEDAGSATVSIPTVNDSNDEAAGEVTVTLTAQAAYQVGTGSDSVDVTDNDPTSVTITAPSGNIAEDGGTKVITVTLGRALVTGESASVVLDPGGAATLGTDYTLLAPTTVPAGVAYTTLGTAPTITFTGGTAPASATVTLRADDDIRDEGDAETVTVGINGTASSATNLGGGLSGSGSASFSITDDDGTPVVSIAAGATVTEASALATFPITISPAPQENLSLIFFVSQMGDFSEYPGELGLVDFSNDYGPLPLLIGTSTTEITWDLLDDRTDEPSGSITIELRPGNGYRVSSAEGASSATVRVLDNDSSTVTLAVAAGDLTELVSPATDKLTISVNRALVDGEEIAVPIEFAGGAIGTQLSLSMATTTGASLNATTGVLTFSSGGQSATVRIAPLLDPDEIDNTITVSLGTLGLTNIDGGASATGSGSFNIIDAGPQPAVDLSATTVALTEGGAAGTYRVKLHTDPGASVTVTPSSADDTRVTVSGALTFTGGATGTWDDWQTVTLTPLPDGDTASEEVVISHAVTGYGSVISGPDLTVSLVDIGAGVTVTPTSLTVQEGSSANYTVVLNSRPSQNVVITPASSAVANATVGGAVTIMPATWDQPRTVQVTGVDRGSANINHAVTSADSSYSGASASPVAVTVGASPRVRVSTTSVTASERGADGVYMVSLNTDPSGTARVTATRSSDEIAVNGGASATLTFNSSNWQTPQRITVRAQPDYDKDNDTAAITHAVTGYGSVSSGPQVSVSTVDIGATMIYLERSADPINDLNPLAIPDRRVTSLTLNEGESKDFYAVITTRARVIFGSVTFPSDLAVSGGIGGNFRASGQTGSRANLSISATSSGSTSGHVCAYVIDPHPDYPQQTAPTSLSQCNAAYTLPVTVNLGDRVNIEPTTLDIEEGGSAQTYEVWLNTDPSGTATVTPVSPDIGAVTVSGALTFNSRNFGDRQQVTVTPVDDDDRDDETVAITHTVADYSGSASGVTVNVDDDDDLPDISIVATAASVVEGGTASFTISADPAPEASLTVNLTVQQTGDYGIAAGSLGSQTVTIAATETSASFTAATAGDDVDETAGSLAATIATGSGYTVAASPANTATVELRDNDATSVTLAVPAGNIAEADGTKTITVTLGRALVSPEVLPVPLSFLGSATRGTDYALTAPNPVPAGLAFNLSGATPSITFTGPSPEAATFTLASTDDDADEGLSESVSVALGTLNASSGTNLHGGAVGSGSGAFAIEDDETTVVPEVSIAAGAAATEGGNATFTVSVSPAISAALTVALNVTQDGTFVAAGNLGADEVIVPAGEASAVFSVATVNDDLDTADGSVTVTITDDAAYTISSTAAAATADVTDNDATIVTLANDVPVTQEASGTPARFTVSLSRALVTGEAIRAPLSYAGGPNGAFTLSGNPNGIDFTSNVLTFTGGTGAATTATIQFFSSRDQDNEDENYTVSFGTVVGRGLGGGASGAGTAAISVLDDLRATQTISVEATSASIDEGGTATFTVTTSRPYGSQLGGENRTVRVGLRGTGAATLPAEFRSLTFPIGTASLPLSVATQTDDVDRPTGAVIATVQSGSDYVVSSSAGTAEVPVNDDDPTTFTVGLLNATIQLNEEDSVNERTTAGNVLRFSFSRGLVAGETVNIPLVFTGGTPGEDFFIRTTLAADGTPPSWLSISSAGVVTISGGETAGFDTYLVVLDDDDGIDERITLSSIGTITHTGLGGSATGTIRAPATFSIIDNDQPSGPAVSIESDGDVTEGTAAAFTLSVSPAPTAELEVSLTVAEEGGFVDSSNTGAQTVTIAADATSAAFTVATLGDTADEPDGSVTVTVASGTGYEVDSPSSAEAAIADDDATTVTLAVTDAIATEGDSSATGAFTVTLGRALVSGESLTAPLGLSGATAGDEFRLALTAASGIGFNAATSTLTFTGGTGASTVATLTLTAEDDDNFADETLTLSLGALSSSGLSGGVEGTGSGDIEITDAGAPEPVISVTAGAGITEGGTATFTVTAAPAPTAELEVALAVSQQGSYVASGNLGSASVTFAANDGSETFTVATQGDNVDEPNGAVVVTVVNGTGYGPSSTSGSAQVAVADDEATSVTLAVTDTTATEGDSSATAAFTVTLGRALAAGEGISVPLTFTGGDPGDDFSMALATATGISFTAATSTLTFTGSASADSVANLTFTALEDDNFVNDTVGVALGAVTVTNLGGGVNASGSGNITVTDAGVPDPVISIAGSAGVTEGGTATFTVTAAPVQPTDTSVSVNVTQEGSYVAADDLGADTVTIPANAASADFTVATVGDSADEPNGSVTVTVTSGSDYEVSSTAGSDEVDVADDDATTVVLAVTDATATEGDSTATAAFTVTLGRALATGEGLTVALGFAGGASGDDFTLALTTATGISFAAATNTLTFSGGAGASSTATLTFSAANDADTTDETVTVSLGTLTPSALGGGVIGSRTGDGEIVITDAGVVGAVIVAGSPVAVTEGGATGSYTVVLATDPGAIVTVTPSSGDTSAVTVSGALTFNTGNWSTPQAVTVTPVSDGDVTNESVSISHAVSGYAGVTSAPTATVTVTDLGRGVVVEPTAIDIDQGDSETYSVVLVSAPAVGTTVSVVAASGDEEVATVSGTPLFTTANWSAPQNVTVTGVGGGSTSISHSITSADTDYSSITPSAVSVSVTAVPAVLLSESTIEVTERGEDSSYDVVLATNPGAEVTVTPVSSDASAASVSAALTFNASNWSTPQTVTVSPEIDNDAVGETVAISHTVTGYQGASAPSDIAVTVTDFGHAILVEPTALSVPAGETASYSVTITSASASGVTLTPTSGADATATVGAGVTLSAADANTAVEIVVTGVAVGQTSITHAIATVDPNYASVAAAPLAVDVTAAAGVRIAPLELALTEGGEDDSYEVRLGTDPGATVTVTPSAGDAGAVTVSGALTFNSTNWSDPQTVTIAAVDDDDRDDESVTITHAVSGYAGVTSAPDVTVTVSDDDLLPTVSVSATVGSVSEGGNATLRVSATPAPAADLEVSLTLAAQGDFFASDALGDVTATIAAGAEFVNVTLPILSDEIDEPNGSLSATLVAGDGYLLAEAPANATVKIIADNDATQVTLASAAGEDIDEDGGSALLRVALGRALQAGEALEVVLELGGSAELGGDYTLAAPSAAPAGVAYSGLDSAPTITFTGGAGASASAALRLVAVSDSIDEGDGESVTIALAALDSNAGTNLGGGASGTGSVSLEIVDDDDPIVLPTVSVSAGPAATEGGEAVFSILANPAPDGEIRVGLSVSDSGAFVAAGDLGERFVTLSAASPSTSVSVATIDDENDEADGAVSVTMQAGEGYVLSRTDASASVSVSDDDATSVSVAASSEDVAENQRATVTVMIGRALAPSETLEVELEISGDAVLGVDYRLEVPAVVPPGVSYAMLDSAPRVIFTGGVAASLLAPIVIVPIADDESEDAGESLSIGVAPNEDIAPSGGAIGSEPVDIDIVEPTEPVDPVPGGTPEVSITANAAIVEGGEALFTLFANPAPERDLAVSVVIAEQGGFLADATMTAFEATVKSGETSTVLRIATARDDLDEADGAVSATVQAGSGYTLAGAPGNAASVVVTDDDATFVTLNVPADSLAEAGGSAVLTVSLGRALVAGESLPVALTFGGSATLGADYGLGAPSELPSGVAYSGIDAAPLITFTGGTGAADTATLTVTAIADDMAEAEDETITVALDMLDGMSGTGLSGGAMGSGEGTLTIIEPEVVFEPTLLVSETTLAITEGGESSYTVALGAEPMGEVTIEIAVTGSAAVELSATSLTFTSETWETAQQVTVTAPEDDNLAGESGALSHTASGGGYDSVGAEVAVTVADNDEASLVVSETTLAITEGGEGSYTVALGAEPMGEVTIEIAATGSAAVELSATSLTFTSETWETAQQVTVTAPEDDNLAGESGALSHTASGGGYDSVGAEVAVTVADNDEASLIVSETLLALVEGGEGSYTIALGAEPSGTVTVSIAATGDAALELSAMSLTFNAGNWNAAQRVSVTASEDDNLADETGSLDHSASGAGFASAGAKVSVTVTDNDTDLSAASSAWMARFGRTVSEQVLEGVGDRVASRRRLDAMPSEGGDAENGLSFMATFAGMDMDDLDLDASRDPFAGQASLGLTGFMNPQRFAGGGSRGVSPGMFQGASLNPDAEMSDRTEPVSAPHSQKQALEQLLHRALSGSAFNLDGRRSDGSQWGLWGRGSVATLEGRSSDGIAIDGDVITGQLGADWSANRWLFGLSFSYSKGDGDYTWANGSGDLESTMSAFTPYISVGTDRFSAWGAVSAGRGDMMLTPDEGATIETDVEMELGAVGLRGELLNFGNGFSVSILSDAFAMQSSADAAVGMPEAEVDVSRVRAAIEAAWSRQMANGGRFSARLEGGVRQDDGDAEEGVGGEVSGGLSWRHGGLIFEIEGRSLVTHEDDNFSQTGASAHLSWDPQPASELGPSLSVRQHWGVSTASGIDQMFEMRDMNRFGLETGAQRLDTELGWGLPAFGDRFVATPFLQHGAQDSAETQTFGWRLAPLDAEGEVLDLDMSFKAVRRIGVTGETEHGIGVEGQVRF